jgi:hypothetical protein
MDSFRHQILCFNGGNAVAISVFVTVKENSANVKSSLFARDGNIAIGSE